MDITEIPVEGYEKVIRGLDAESGLHALIAVHDTTLGPGLGGVRMLPFASEDEALTDALRLAEGMTYKAAIARTGQGGGKAVILGDPARKTPALFRAFGRLVDSLGGAYLTAEDMNVQPEDLLATRETTRHVTGLPEGHGGSGSPSPATALGVFSGLKAVVEATHGSTDLGGRSVLVQGVGSVGGALALLLADAGALVTVCDLDEDKARRLARKRGFEHVSNDAWIDVECDVYSPCARGATLSAATIPRLKCRAVGGAANNQLATPGDGDLLHARGIVYAPDYVMNAGGILNIAVELRPEGYDRAESERRCRGIEGTVREVLAIARDRGLTPAAAADRLAHEIIAAGRAR